LLALFLSRAAGGRWMNCVVFENATGGKWSVGEMVEWGEVGKDGHASLFVGLAAIPSRWFLFLSTLNCASPYARRGCHAEHGATVCCIPDPCVAGC
jgi:hypothetical protein